MKPLPLFLVASISANLLLAVVWWSSPASAPSGSVVSASAGTGLALTEAPTPPGRGEQALTPAIWQELAADLTEGPESDAAWVARLRAAGFSPEILRAVVRHRIHARYDQREADLIASQPPFAYWKTTVFNFGDGSPTVRAELRSLALEKERLLVNLLGPDADTPEDMRSRERRYGPIDRLKAAELDAIAADYRDLENEIRSESLGMTRPDDREKLQLLAAERERDIAALLTPEELSAYQLRAGETARRLQSRIGEFGATREEYESIHALQSAFDAEYGVSTGGLTREQRAARSAAEKQLNDEIAAALGPERFAEFEALTSNDYRSLKQLTDLLELPATVALEAAPLRDQITTASREIMRDRALPPDQRNAQLTALRETTRQELAGLLGEDGLSAYENSPAGQWLKYIVPLPQPLAPARTGP